MDDLISVVIPVYNVEKYLEKCLDSVVGQTYGNLEIILVDDGSTDNSGAICDRYAQKDSRVVVIHQKNGGLSKARNVGIDKATGKYISFIDSDDYVGSCYIETLYKALPEDGKGISVCDFLPVETDDAEQIPGTGVWDMGNPEERLEKMYHPQIHGMSFLTTNKLFERSLFTENGILFPEGRVHEDDATIPKIVYFAQRLNYTDAVMYFYRRNPNSIMHTKARNLDCVLAGKELCSFFAQQEEPVILGFSLNDFYRRVLYEWRYSRKNDSADERARKTEILLKEYRQGRQYESSCQISRIKLWRYAITFGLLAVFQKLGRK